MLKKVGVKMYKLILALIEYVARKWQYKSRLEGKLDTVLSQQTNQERRLLRLEILEAMRRNDRAVVHSLYDEYKLMNGNSYMNELYKQYTSEKQPTRRSKR